ncbi:hypothetical protein PAPHI01_0432 [Pancytospora philotis]|nr:hypothetical protein PAPHI01_0432 [Pancytospora philotis]
MEMDSRNVHERLHAALLDKKASIKAFLLERNYSGALRQMNRISFPFMIPRCDYDAFQITPYSTEVSDVLGIPYVNASFIQGLAMPTIAVQYPKAEYYERFREMVLRSGTALILSLTGCAEYFSDSERTSSREIRTPAGPGSRVFLRDQTYDVEGHAVRVIRVEGWPDHGVLPPAEMQQFYEYVETLEQTVKNEPQMIHCRAGVGRTGTYVMYKLLKGAPCISVDTFLDTLLRLRSYRPLFVETSEQLEFLCDAFLSLADSSSSKASENRVRQ